MNWTFDLIDHYLLGESNPVLSRSRTAPAVSLALSFCSVCLHAPGWHFWSCGASEVLGYPASCAASHPPSSGVHAQYVRSLDESASPAFARLLVISCHVVWIRQACISGPSLPFPAGFCFAPGWLPGTAPANCLQSHCAERL